MDCCGLLNFIGIGPCNWWFHPQHCLGGREVLQKVLRWQSWFNLVENSSLIFLEPGIVVMYSHLFRRAWWAKSCNVVARMETAENMYLQFGTGNHEHCKSWEGNETNILWEFRILFTVSPFAGFLSWASPNDWTFVHFRIENHWGTHHLKTSPIAPFLHSASPAKIFWG